MFKGLASGLISTVKLRSQQRSTKVGSEASVDMSVGEKHSRLMDKFTTFY
jgi:hypothetical protein